MYIFRNYVLFHRLACIYFVYNENHFVRFPFIVLSGFYAMKMSKNESKQYENRFGEKKSLSFG